MGMNSGLTERQLRAVFDLIETSVNKEQAEIARRSLTKIARSRPKQSAGTGTMKMEADMQDETWSGIFPKGDRAPRIGLRERYGCRCWLKKQAGTITASAASRLSPVQGATGIRTRQAKL